METTVDQWKKDWRRGAPDKRTFFLRWGAEGVGLGLQGLVERPPGDLRKASEYSVQSILKCRNKPSGQSILYSRRRGNRKGGQDPRKDWGIAPGRDWCMNARFKNGKILSAHAQKSRNSFASCKEASGYMVRKSDILDQKLYQELYKTSWSVVNSLLPSFFNSFLQIEALQNTIRRKEWETTWWLGRTCSGFSP